MHIVLDCRCVHPHMGGIGRSALELARSMAAHRREHQLRVLLGSCPPANLGIKGAELAQCDAAMIDERFEQLHLPKILEDLRADLYLNPTFSIPAVKTTTRQIAFIHDVVFEDRPEWVEPGLRTYLQRWSRFSAGEADHIITVSDHALSRIKKVYGIRDSRLTRIYGGMSPECFLEPSNADLNSVRRKFRLDPPYILYLGTLEPKKGTPELIAAFGRCAKAGFKGSLVLAGGKSGPDFDFERLIANSGHSSQIRCLGYIDETDKKPLLKGSRLFVFPSHYEGFGLPPLEAMALGIPCVVSDQTSLPEVTGGAALTANVTDQASFVKILDRGLHDESFRNRARIEGPKRARFFSWDRCAKGILDLCEMLEAA